MWHILLAVTSFIYGTIDGAIYQKDVKHWIISPKENCKPVCPCIMDGINYDHGDRWQQKGQPCTTYECRNGYYQAVYRGCEYKGKCKDSGSIWTEGCFTYKCFTSDIWSYYRLIQGGCADDEGNCWKVGESVNRNCNRYECQIVGAGCYKLITKSAGCAYQGTCKSFNSYWHNGCSIFQCVNNSNIIGYEKLSNEVMFWPEGDYALMKVKTGCPRDKPEEWEEGNRLHYGNDKNYKSDNFDLFGNYSNLIFDHHFCVHQENNDTSYIPRYQTYWEPGQYCILRKGGTCPEGFKSGYVGMDDLNGLEFMFVTNGSLPDGNYTKDTGFFFCCRHDGYTNAPIVLPKDEAFVLFMSNGSNDCQEVRGMTYELQYFAFDDDDFNTEVYQNGSLPMIMREGNVTVFYYCYYKPLDCGCQDDQGNFLKVGEKISKDCAEYQCREVQGIRYLDVVVGGCKVAEGVCKKENETWMESSGETCHVKTCLRDEESSRIQFKISTQYVGCRDEDQCVAVGSKRTNGCYDLRCIFPSRGGNPRFKMLKAGCSDGKGGCIPLGQLFKRGCLTYRCRDKPSKCELEFVKGACSYNGVCREVGESWTSKSCNKLSCSMSVRNGTSYLFAVDIAEYGCNYMGKCYKVGENTTDGCYTKQCTVDPVKKYVYMDIVNGACNLEGKCIPVNATLQKDCGTYRCFWRREGRSHSFGLDVVKYGCKYGGKCLDEGEVIDKNCIGYMCSVTEKAGKKYATLEPTSKACRDSNGGCIQLGTEMQDERCYHRRCALHDGWPTMSIFKGGCHYNGTCHDEDSTWTNSKDCVTYKCTVEKRNGSFRSSLKIVDVGCTGSGRSTCRAHNETWMEGCYQKRCLVSGDNAKMFARIESKPQGCMINGMCRQVGYKTFYQGCHEYMCIYDDKIRQARFSFHAGGCKWQSKCVKEGEYAVQNCIAYKCSVTKTNGRVITSMKADLDNSSCKDSEGNCVRLGETLLDESSCYYKQCMVKGNRLGFNYVRGGCKVGGVCRDAGTNWTNANGCVTYQCVSENRNGHWSSRTKMVDVSCCCRSGKACKRKAETWIEGCYKKTCHISQTGEKFSTRISMKPNGCKLNGKCQPVGYTEFRNGCFKYGCVYNDQLQMPRFQFLKGGCKDSKSKCHNPGDTWNQKYGSSCFQALCVKRGNSYGTKFKYQDKSNCEK